jgi:hypothetical protein
MPLVLLWCLSWLPATVLLADSPKAFRLSSHADHIDILQGDVPVATYHLLSGNKPIVWPLLGPDGVSMTRAYPMSDKDSTEKKDHGHHRSLWFTHGEVNGVDFWAETPKSGTVTHEKFLKQEASGDRAILEAVNHWNAPDGKRVLTETRRLTFHGTPSLRMIDCQFQLTASDGDVHFGDTKEGTFAIRVAETMKVDAKTSGKILNAEGKTDAAAWGQMANWVDYTGPIQNKTYGIAILCHPSSFKSPGRWHVRTYGLFAHNPFGLKDFVGNADAKGGYTLPKDQSMTLAYRVILHPGDSSQANLEQHWKTYAAGSIKPF